MIKLKVCGMRDKKNIQEVAAVEPDYMGFIFYQASPRFVGQNFEIPLLSPTVERVGVFVNETTGAMLEKVERFQLNYLQLHGSEPVRQLEEIRKKDVKIIKVFSVDDQFDFNVIRPYKPFSDYFLFDTKGKYYGGNAKRFNWEILTGYDHEIPFFLSGGIGPENLGELNGLSAFNVYAVDINSGVEISAGLKDVQKVKDVKRILNSK
jgi:phosphoribosylanthranilate isomerase